PSVEPCAKGDFGNRPARIQNSCGFQPRHESVGHASRSAIFSRSGQVRSRALAGRADAPTSALCLFPVWWRPKTVHWGGLCHHGSESSAGEHCAEIPAECGARPSDRAGTQLYPATQIRHSHDDSAGAFVGARSIKSRLGRQQPIASEERTSRIIGRNLAAPGLTAKEAGFRAKEIAGAKVRRQLITLKCRLQGLHLCLPACSALSKINK